MYGIQLQEQDWDRARLFMENAGLMQRHLGWEHPLMWLGRQPFLAAVDGNSISGLLACPPDEDGITWLRLFGVRSKSDVKPVWELLWPRAVSWLQEKTSVTDVYSLLVEDWLQDPLEQGGFFLHDTVVVLSWDLENGPFQPQQIGTRIRRMKREDLPAVYEIDRAAFQKTWRNSRSQLENALRAAAVATVAEEGGTITGYQISTASSLGGHVARLAVHPSHQGAGIGTDLVRDVLERFQDQGVVRVTVNTQHRNRASLQVYRRLGFERDDQEYPVYRFAVREA